MNEYSFDRKSYSLFYFIFQIALVEWNNGTMYLGLLEDKKLTFTKTIVGKVKQSFKMKNSNFIINTSDIQTIDSRYIITKFISCVKRNKIFLTDEQRKNIEESVQDYISKQN